MTTSDRALALRLVSEVADLRRRVDDRNAPQLAFSSIENGAITDYDEDGNVAAIIGQQFDGSHTVASVAGPVPPTMSTPILTPASGGFTARWDGLFVDANGVPDESIVLPADWSRGEVHVSTDPAFDPTTAATLVNTIETPRGGDEFVAVPEGDYYARFVARSLAGKSGAPSAVATVHVDPAGTDPALAAQLDQLSTDLDTAEADIAATSADLAQTKTDLDGRLDTAEADLTDHAARLTAAEGDIDSAFTQVGAAQTDATAALTMAGSKSKVYYSTAVASGSGTAAGDLWRQYDGASHNVTAEWYWTGSAWQPSQITTTAIANLDVGKLTVGAGVISELVAQHIAAQTATFQTVDVANLFVTTGTLSEAVINKLYADVVRSRVLTADRIMVGTGGNLVPNGAGELGAGVGWAAALNYDTTDVPTGLRASFRSAPASGTVQGSTDYVDVLPNTEYVFELWLKADKPSSNFYLELRDQNGNQAATMAALPDGTAFASSTGGFYLLQNYTVPTVWTKVGAVVKTDPDCYKVRISGMYFNHTNGTERTATVWLAGLSLRPRVGTSIIATGAIIAPHITASEEMSAKLGEFLHVHAGQIDTDALNFMSATGLTVTAGTYQTDAAPDVGLKLDSTGLRAYSPDGGDPVTEIRTDGGTVYSVTDPATGDVLASLGSDGTIAGQSLNIATDATIGGDPLIGSVSSSSFAANMDGAGLLEYMPRGMVVRGYRDISNFTATNKEGEIMELSYDNLPGRAYRIHVTPFPAYIKPDTYGLFHIYRTNDGSRPTMASSELHRIVTRNQGVNSIMIPFGGTFYDLGASGRVRYLFTFEGLGGQMLMHSIAAFRVWVEDIGFAIPDTGIDRTGTRDNGGTAPAPPATVEPTTYTKTYAPTGYRTYDGDGSTSGYMTTKMFQGQSPGTSNVKRSIATFPSMTGDLSGATITSIKAYFYFDQWYYNSGGTADIMLHGQSSLPATRPTMTNAVNSANWPKPGGRWVSIPSTYWAGFKSGTYRGVGLGDGTSGYLHYGYAAGYKTRIQVKYTK